MPTAAENYDESGAAADDAETWWNQLGETERIDIYRGTRDYDNTLRDWIRDQMLERLGDVG